nr:MULTISPECIES: hypothetical protein [Nocardia]
MSVLTTELPGIRLHGLGVKTTGLSRYGALLSSADSMAWSYCAPRTPAAPPQPDVRIHPGGMLVDYGPFTGLVDIDTTERWGSTVELGLTTFAALYPVGDRPAPTAGERLREVVEDAVATERAGLDVYGVGERHRKDFADPRPPSCWPRSRPVPNGSG